MKRFFPLFVLCAILCIGCKPKEQKAKSPFTVAQQNVIKGFANLSLTDVDKSIALMDVGIEEFAMVAHLVSKESWKEAKESRKAKAKGQKLQNSQNSIRFQKEAENSGRHIR